MRLMTRMMVALAVSVLAALALYFVFLNDTGTARDQVQPTDHHSGYSSTSDTHSVRHPMQASE